MDEERGKHWCAIVWLGHVITLGWDEGRTPEKAIALLPFKFTQDEWTYIVSDIRKTAEHRHGEDVYTFICSKRIPALAELSVGENGSLVVHTKEHDNGD